MNNINYPILLLFLLFISSCADHDTQTPYIEFLHPNRGDTLRAGQEVRLHVKASDDKKITKTELRFTLGYQTGSEEFFNIERLNPSHSKVMELDTLITLPEDLESSDFVGDIPGGYEFHLRAYDGTNSGGSNLPVKIIRN